MNVIRLFYDRAYGEYDENVARVKVKKTRIYFKNLKDRYKALEDER